MSVWYPEARVVVHAVFDGFGPPRDQPISFPAVPISIDVVRNGYDQPDSWSVEFERFDLPISPEMIRAAAIEIYIYDKGALPVELSGVPGSPLVPGPKEPTIAGLADTCEVDYEDGVLHLAGQDYTALFAEKGWRTNDRGNPDPLPTGKRIDQVVQQLMSEVDVTNEMRLDIRLPFPVAELPIVGAATTRVLKDGFHTASEANYWSIISKMCTQHGLLCFVEGTKLVLTTSGAAYRDPKTVFEVEWGRNLESLSLERKMGRERAPQIEVRVYDDEDQETIVVRYPAEDKNTGRSGAAPKHHGRLTTTHRPPPKSGKPNGRGQMREERRVFRLYGIRDRKILEAFCRGAHDELGRGEFKIKFATGDMQDRRGLRFLDMHAGAAVQPRFDPLWKELRGMEEDQRAAYLLSKHYDAKVAVFVAKNYTKIAAFHEAMYLREARISWAVEDGFSLQGELVNFIKPARDA